MALSIKALERFRALREDAHRIRTAEERYNTATAPKNVDKHAFRFGTGDRSTAFRVTVGLESYTGTYGSSSVYQFLSLYGDKRDVEAAFVKALNKLRPQILQAMADIMDGVADTLKDDATAEISALQELIKGVEAGETAEEGVF